MSILVIGDLHYKQSNTNQSEIAENDIMNIINNNEILFVVILGDTLDTHERIYVDCYMRACRFFKRIMDTGVHLFVLIGNHDRPNNKVFLTDEHPFGLYKMIPGITIVDTCHVFEFDPRKYGIDIYEEGKIMKFCFVPYVPDDRYLEALSVCNIVPEDMTMFFSHNEFDGCNLSKITKKKCDAWPKNFPMNISGHLHNEEQVQNNLLYIGTPYQHEYNDSPDKGVFLIDVKSGSFALDKIVLNVPSKITLKIHWTELETIILDHRYDIKLEITGPSKEVKKLMKRNDMLIKFASVQKRYIEEHKQVKDMPEILHDFQFYELMILSLQNRPDLLNIFNHNFPDFAPNLSVMNF